MRSTWTALFVLLWFVSHASGQTAAPNDPTWSVSAAVYTYLLPDEGNYAQPTFAADRGWFHVEARYNYEAIRTGSLWAGYNFSGGTTVAWEITPMVGGVFGSTTGVAPGYTGSVSWWKLDLYSEGEIVFDAEQWSDSFAYNWSELAIVPAERFRFGLVTQRTRAYDSGRDIQRGLFAGVSYRNLEATTYVFYPDNGTPTVVVSVELSL